LKDQKLDELKPAQKPEIITQNNVYGNAQQDGPTSYGSIKK